MSPQDEKPDQLTTPAPRIYGLIARAAPVGVLFRRGPSKQVLLVSWDMERDRFYPGQWLKGRIYERYCDLSPDGKHLVYYAANQRPPIYSWTAVSRPPYLTAVVFWPNPGTLGGGLFDTESHLRLNHRSGYFAPAEEMEVPRELTVTPLGPNAGYGDDRPVLHARLRRDGWVLVQDGREIACRNAGYGEEAATVWHRPQPRGEAAWDLRMTDRRVHKRRGSWNMVEYALTHPATAAEIPLGPLDWADWCRSGDLVFAKDGGVWRLPAEQVGCEAPLETARLLVDLGPLSFRELAPPPEAREWSTEVPLPTAI